MLIISIIQVHFDIYPRRDWKSVKLLDLYSGYENRDWFNQNAWTIHFVAFVLKIFIITNFFGWVQLINLRPSFHGDFTFFLIDSYIWFPSNNCFLCFRYGRWYFVCLVHLVLSAFQNHRCAMKSNHLTIHLFSFSSSYTQSSNSFFFFYNRFGTFWQKKKLN